MTSGFVAPPRCLEHGPFPGHPERPSRLVAIEERLAACGLGASVARLEPRAARAEELADVHTPAYLTALAATRGRPGRYLDADTPVSPASFDAALSAAGGVLEAVERVLDRRWANAFCAVRPPGHHAERDRAMGFCLLNNVAIAAARLRAAHGLARVAIVDWDVHHGNGTQHAFEDDPSVFYASLHQWPFYPGTGAASERGRGAGDGATLNCPLPAGTGDAAWLSAFEERVLPALEAFRPEFVLVSAGFDAHRDDPLAALTLSEDAYREMTRGLLALAERTAGGRLVSVLEGGYDLGALARCVEAHVGALVEGAACA